MRLLEAAILLSLLPAVLGWFLPAHRRPRWLLFVPFLALGFTALHLLIEGFRWQMVPAYAVAMVLGLLSARALRSGAAPTPAPRPPSGWLRATARVLGATVLLLVLVVCATVSLAFPMFTLPQPSGEYTIGTMTLEMLDASRPETFTDDPNDKRDLMLQAWYPAEKPAAGVKPEPFWGSDPRRRQMLAKSLRQPGFLFNHLAMIPSHAYADAKVAGAGSYPVLIFSHGYAQGFNGQNTMLMEELASNGYVVLSIGHPYESSTVVYPDGRAVGMKQEQIQKVLGGEVGTGIGKLADKIKASTDKAERLALVRELVASAPTLTTSVHLWVADTKFVLDQLALLNGEGSTSAFKGRLDLSRVGVLGMSFGGTTAGQAVLDDARISAGLNLDGTQYGDLLDRPVQKPFLWMNGPGYSQLNEPMFENSAAPAWYLVVKGTQHFDFTDFPRVAPVFGWLGASDQIAPRRAVQITNAYTLAFFNQFLKHQPSPLLAGPSAEYPEVGMQMRAGTTEH